MKYAVVTGTSKGLGASIAKLLLKQGIHIIGIARHENKELEQVAADNKVTYQHETGNLANSAEMERIFSSISARVFTENVELVYLINNAAVVGPIDKAGSHDHNGLTNHVHVNLLAPMISTNLFLQQADKANLPVVIANVTSGAANRSTYGWSAYGSSKAGLNRYTETVALEQAELNTNNKVILFDPSIMDTDMQQQIRSSDEQAFKDVAQFKQYKQNNSLRDTDVVAGALVDVLTDNSPIKNGKTYSVKELL